MKSVGSRTCSLLGLVLQFKDAFKEHREARNAIVFIVLGVFIGSLITSIRGVSIDFGGASISPFQALIAAFVLVLAVIAFIGAVAKESERRNELFGFAGMGLVGLIILLFMGSIGSAIYREDERELKKLRIEEFVDLATLQDSRGNYDRAIFLLTEARSRVSSDADRRKVLEDRIREIERKQVGGK